MALSEFEKYHFMREALYEAKKAQNIGEIPIGCVVVLDGKIIGRGHNLREHSEDATMHAEMIAIQEANMTVHSWLRGNHQRPNSRSLLWGIRSQSWMRWNTDEPAD